jgi:hypothetical protein
MVRLVRNFFLLRCVPGLRGLCAPRLTLGMLECADTIISEETSPCCCQRNTRGLNRCSLGVATIVVFVIDLVGNSITFSNRYLSALVIALVFAIVFGGLVYFRYGNVSMSV